jgi:hypothetical protein
MRSVDPFDTGHLSEADREAEAEVGRRRDWGRMSEQTVMAKVRALDGHPIRNELGRILAIALWRYCPQYLSLLPEEWRGAANDNRQGGTAA